MRLAGLGLSTSLLLQACVASPLDFDAERAAIVDGETTSELEAVVAIGPRRIRCGDRASVLCSGTLIAADAVLSAAHCFDSMRPGLGYEVFVGDMLGPEAEALTVLEVITHPDFDSETRRNDVAVLWLAQRVDGVVFESLPESDSAAPEPGAAVTLAGFGATDAGGAPDGVKRLGIGRLSELSAGVVTVDPDPSVSCVGDSGGPLFTETGELIGVASSGDTGCSVDSVYALIAPTIEDFIGPVLQTGPAERPPSADSCGTDCAMDADCPTGFVCVPDPEGFEFLCALPGQEAGALAQACSDDGGCGFGFCAVSGADPECQCYQPCDSKLSRSSNSGCAVGEGDRGRTSIWLLALLLWIGIRRKS